MENYEEKKHLSAFQLLSFSAFKLNNAFTLIELIIVISIAIILATIGVLNLYNYRTQNDLEMTVKEIVSTLRVARNYSISQESIESGSNKKWGVYFESGNYILYRGINYNDAGKTIASKSILRPTIEFKTMPNPQDVIFEPITGKPNAANFIEISLKSNPANFKTITINSNGQIE